MPNKLLTLLLAALLLATTLAACASPADDAAPDESAAPIDAAVEESAADTAAAAADVAAAADAGDPWWNDAVFYEVFVRSFYDSDGDGVGDINGLIEKLDYLNDGDPNTTDDLGVTGIWLMPIMESPSYHGYDVVDYYTVDEEYGTNDDFKRLMEEAHARGIRVIVDLVLNHTADDHEWFQASRDPNSPYRDWYVWEDEDPGFRGPFGQQAWHQLDGDYYYGIFWGGMPDLNFKNPDVTQQMFDITGFWLEEMGVDGFRLDAIKHLVEEGRILENANETHAWLQEFYRFYKDINPEAFAVGEAWTSTEQVLKYTGDEVDIAFEFDLALAILNAADLGVAPVLGRAQSAVVDAYPPGQYATFLTNHDQNRVMSEFDGDTGRAKVAAGWLLTSPGVPFIYYGEEIGQQGVKPDEDIRRPMQWASDAGDGVGFTTGTPWRAPFDDYETRSVALQTDDPTSLLSHYRSLIHLRHDHEALRTGDWIPVEARPGKVYAYLRHAADETLLVILNFDDEAVDNYTLALESSPLAAVSGVTVLYGGGAAAAPTIDDAGGFADYRPIDVLPPFSTHVITLDR